MEIKFSDKEESRGWEFRQGALNIDKFFAEKGINKACKVAAEKIQELINKNREKEIQTCLNL